jgi:acetolactate synthase I/II/III large subunit
MYTVQALWTMAREALDIVVVVFVNHSYKILNIELMRTGAKASDGIANNLLGLASPKIDWVGLATSLGVHSERADTAEAFDAIFANAMARRGPTLIAAEIE